MIDFGDLDDALGSASGQGKPSSNEDIRKDAHIANGGGAADSPCPRCAGSGRYRGRVKSFVCNGCGGSGRVTANRARGMAAHIKGKATKAMNYAAWRNENRETLDLFRQFPNAGFLERLLADVDQGNILSQNAIDAGLRVVAKFQASRKERDKEREKKSGDVGVERINKLFETAMENGLKRPMFRTERLIIKLAKHHPDTLYVCDNAVEDRERGGAAYVGKIVNGRFEARREAEPDTLKLLVRIAKNPLKAAVEYGRSTGICCCCGRELTDPVSVENGIGPICQGKWGL